MDEANGDFQHPPPGCSAATPLPLPQQDRPYDQGRYSAARADAQLMSQERRRSQPSASRQLWSGDMADPSQRPSSSGGSLDSPIKSGAPPTSPFRSADAQQYRMPPSSPGVYHGALTPAAQPRSVAWPPLHHDQGSPTDSNNIMLESTSFLVTADPYPPAHRTTSQLQPPHASPYASRPPAAPLTARTPQPPAPGLGQGAPREAPAPRPPVPQLGLDDKPVGSAKKPQAPQSFDELPVGGGKQAAQRNLFANDPPRPPLGPSAPVTQREFDDTPVGGGGGFGGAAGGMGAAASRTPNRRSKSSPPVRAKTPSARSRTPQRSRTPLQRASSSTIPGRASQAAAAAAAPAASAQEQKLTQLKQLRQMQRQAMGAGENTCPVSPRPGTAPEPAHANFLSPRDASRAAALARLKGLANRRSTAHALNG